jgi:hypothetical protein
VDAAASPESKEEVALKREAAAERTVPVAV